MRKSFKKAVAVVSAIAMVVAGISYQPAKVTAADFTAVNDDTVGNWGLYAANGSWTVGSMSYAGTGTIVNDDIDMTLRIDQSSGNAGSWGLQAKYPVTNLDATAVYDIAIKYTSTAAGTMHIKVEENGTQNGTGENFTTVEGENTYTRKIQSVSQAQVVFELSGFPANTEIDFESITFTTSDEEITTEANQGTLNAWTSLGAWQYFSSNSNKIIITGGSSWDDSVSANITKTGWAEGDTQFRTPTFTAEEAGTYTLTLTNTEAGDTSSSFVNVYNSSDQIIGTSNNVNIGELGGSGSNPVTATYTVDVDLAAGDSIYGIYVENWASGGTRTISANVTKKASEETTVEEATVEETTVEETTVEEPTEAPTEAPTEVAGYDWVKLGNGSGDAAGDAVYYDDNSDVNVSFVNIQKSFGTEAGVYTTYAAGISKVVVNGVQQPSSCIQGAGALIYLSSLTKEINEVTVEYAGGTASFLLKTENPATPSDETTEAPTEESTEAPTEAPTEEPTEKQPGEFVVIKDDGGQDTDYSYDNSTGATIVNIQSPGFTTERGIYTNVPSGISSVTVNGTEIDSQNIQGAGAIIPLSSLVEGENTVVIKHALGTETVIVKYEPAATTTYTVTVDGTKVADVEAGDTYTLPTTAQYGYFTGDDLYKAGAQVVVNGDIDFTSLNSVAVEMAEGAVVKNAAPAGIAFQATVTVNENEEAVDAAFLSTGMLITANDLFVEKGGSELALDSDYTFKNVENTGWFAGNTGTYRVGITGVTSENYIRKFIARGYAKLTYTDGTDTVVYSGMSPVRSIQQVAQAAINAGYGNDFLAECAAAK